MKTGNEIRNSLLLMLGICVVLALHSFHLIPYQIRQRATSSSYGCINHLRQLDAAINQWVLVNGKHAGDPVTLEDLKPYIKLNPRGEIPPCPDGGKYSVTVVGAPPTCSQGTNSITGSVHNYFYGEDSDSKASKYHRLP